VYRAIRAENPIWRMRRGKHNAFKTEKDGGYGLDHAYLEVRPRGCEVEGLIRIAPHSPRTSPFDGHP